MFLSAFMLPLSKQSFKLKPKTAPQREPVSLVHGRLDDLRTNILENWGKVEQRLERAKVLIS